VLQDGTLTELGYLLADDNAIDLDAWLDAKRWLLGCPRKLIKIGLKLYTGEPMTGKDYAYLERWRKKELSNYQLALA
jgi:hypothetical protein